MVPLHCDPVSLDMRPILAQVGSLSHILSHPGLYFLFLFLSCLTYGLLGPHGPDSDCTAHAHMTYVYVLTTVLVMMTHLLRL
jgi:hypothetical protein